MSNIRERNRQGANKPEQKKPGGESARNRGRKSQGENKPESE